MSVSKQFFFTEVAKWKAMVSAGKISRKGIKELKRRFNKVEYTM